MIEVSLTEDELRAAAAIGVHRHISCILTKDYKDEESWHGKEGSIWTTHIEGAAAEIVVAKTMRAWWTALNPKSKADVGSGIAVRWTAHKNGVLFIYDKDPDELRYFFVVGEAPRYSIVGWIFTSQAKRIGVHYEAGSSYKSLRISRPRWVVEQRQLNPWPMERGDPRWTAR